MNSFVPRALPVCDAALCLPSRRTFLRRAFAATALCALAAPAAWGAAVPKVKIRLATLLPKDTSGHKSLLALAARWREATQGAVDIANIYTDGVMGSEVDMLRRIRAGQLHAAVLTSLGLAEIDPEVNCIQKMPLVFRTLDEQAYVRRALFPRFQKNMREKGYELLFMSDAGWVQLFSKTPAVLPEDFRKLKFFAERSDEVYARVMREVGFQPVPLEFTDILTGLSAGNMLEALASAPFYALAGQFYNSAKHMVELNWAPLSGGAVISRKVWDGLPADTRTELLKSAAQTGEEIQAVSRKESDEAVAAMAKRGLTVHRLDAQARATWEQFAEGLQKQVRGNLVPPAAYDEAVRLVKAYRDQNARPGQ